MTGAEIISQTAKNTGVDICFANAGITELPLVTALDTASGIRPVLGVFEGVCTGPDDGSARHTVQSLCSQAHEKAKVVTITFSNHKCICT